MKIDHITGPIIIAVVINLVLPQIVKQVATDTQKDPPAGAASLNYFDQLVHMFVHHAEVPITSSIIIAVIVLASILLSQVVFKTGTQ